ncbi:MFS transporter [Streptomyces sp. NPDC041068]|uniref:MFS transporter n=1 Tax=Streptomyces sp. NPDC041068 TaxID=3155130 RepID=UPI00340F45F2
MTTAEAHDRTDRPGRRHVLVTKVWVLSGLVAVADFVFGAVFVTVMGDSGLSAAVIGGLLASTSITSLLLEAPSGAWGDRYGHKRLVVVGLTVWGAGFLLFARATGALAFGAAIVLWASGLALHSGAAQALLVNTLNAEGEEDRGTGAVRGAETIRWAAAAVGACLVAASAWTVDTRTAVTFAGLVLLAAALWVALSWPESPKGNGLTVWRSLASGIRLVLSKKCRLLLLFSVLASVDLGIIILTWQPAAKTVAGLSTQWLGLVLLVLSVAAAAGAAATRWASRVEPAPLLGLLLLGLNLSLLCASSGGFGAGVAYLGAEFFVGAALTTLAVWGQQVFPDDLRATAASVLGTATGITIALTHGVMGSLWDRLGLVEAVTLVAALLGLCALAAGVTRLSSRS